MTVTDSYLAHNPNIVFLDRATIPQHIDIPRLAFTHQWQQFDITTSEQVVARIADADVVITNKVVLTAEILAQAKHLRLVAVAATGTNNVDIDYCRQAGIAVCNVQGYGTRSVPEHVMAMLFALRRNLRAYQQDIAQGVWQQQKQFCFFTHPIQDIAGATLGVVGRGSLGQAVATLAQAMGMKVLFAERKGALQCRAGYVPFEQVLAQADVVSLHCPLSEETQNLIAQAELQTMKSSAILINAGRGGLVNEDDLVAALKQGQIAGAGCDVFSQEPADEDNPLIVNIDLPNLLLTPHVAWGSDSAIQTLCAILIANIEQFQQGNLVNRIC